MQYRHLFPMVRLLLPFMAGIILSIVISATSTIPLYYWIGILFLSLAAGFYGKNKNQNWLFGAGISIFLFITGYNSVLLHKEILRPDHFSKMQKQGIFIAYVAEPLQEKEHSYKTILRIKAISKGNTVENAQGHILTYFAKDSTTTLPDEGSIILFSGTVQEISPPQNPGAFDYQKYIATNNVYHQLYLNPVSWLILENPKGFSIKRTAYRISQRFISILDQNGLKGQEFAVASALILGQNDMLDNETRQAYSGSGVTHILSVSGLHVGVIFIVINFLLGFMKKKGGQLYLKTGIILLTIWAYALLTGMSPPVMRSAAMFTFISLGNASKRYVHIINSLSVSALFLLLINPLMISNIGFQLSYLALVGITFINKPIADLWEPKYKIADYIWGLIAVSLAAQIATAPLTILYFKQFPAYFIPANLIAIPVSFLAIYSGLAVLVTSFWPFVSNLFGVVTNFLLLVMNHSVEFIEHLPYSVLKITSVFTTDMILLYLLLISILLLFHFKRKELVYVSLFFLLLVSVSFMQTGLARQNQQKIIFYSSNKQTAIGYVSGKQQILIADSVLLNNIQARKFQLDGATALFGTKDLKEIALGSDTDTTLHCPSLNMKTRNEGVYMLVQNKRIFIASSIPKTISDNAKLKVDYLIIRQNPRITIQDILKLYKPEMIIIDASNSEYRTEKWINECKKAGIDAYSIKKSGALTIDLQG